MDNALDYCEFKAESCKTKAEEHFAKALQQEAYGNHKCAEGQLQRAISYEELVSFWKGSYETREHFGLTEYRPHHE